MPNTEPESTQDITVNEYTRLVKYEGLGKEHKEKDADRDLLYDTGISAGEYACGVFGLAALHGDMDEYYSADIVKVLLYERDGQWRLKVNFKTHKRTILDLPFLPDSTGDGHEHWNVDVLCVSRDLPPGSGPSPAVFVEAFPGLGDNVKDHDTGYSVDKYVCGIAGFAAKDGDINEGGRGDIIQVYLEPGANRNWHIRADFRTHNDSEDWDIRILCVSTEHASDDGPERGKLYFLEEFRRRGDNIRFDTDIDANKYVCGVVGFAARNGDINGNDRGDILQAYAYEGGDAASPTGHIRADFRSHDGFGPFGGDGHENWDVNVLCAALESVRTEQNVSYEAFGGPPCLLSYNCCQILEHEFVDLTGPVTILGGGVTEGWTRAGTACTSLDHIEVYISVGVVSEPRFSGPPDDCLLSGDTITLQPGRIYYEFRGASVVGSAPIPFELRAQDAAPGELTATPRMFDGEYEARKKWGPGMALTWTATAHPDAKYYAIDYSEDSGRNWQPYVSNRDVLNNQGQPQNWNQPPWRPVLRLQLLPLYQTGATLHLSRSGSERHRGGADQLVGGCLCYLLRLAGARRGRMVLSPQVRILGAQARWSSSAFRPIRTGRGLSLRWEFTTWRDASYTIVSGCQSGRLSNPNAKFCMIRIQAGSKV